MITAFLSGLKAMYITDPTGFGKTFLFYYICQKIRNIDPDIKFVIAAAQVEQVQEIAQAFDGSGFRTIVIRGKEDQMRSLISTKKGLKELEKAKTVCLDYIASAYAGSKDIDFIKKEKTDFENYINAAVTDIHSIESWNTKSNQLPEDHPDKKQINIILDSKRFTLSDNYSKAEKIIEKALRHVAEEERDDQLTNWKGKKPSKEEKELILQDAYNAQLPYMTDVEKLFPDITFEISDVIVITHAKAMYSILNKRDFKLYNVTEEDGRHIVLFIDEVESFITSFSDNAITDAVKRSADMLSLLDMIHASILSGHFDSHDYIVQKKNGAISAAVAEKARDILLKYDELEKNYKYKPNMHMGEASDPKDLPQITNSADYIITNNVKNKYICGDSDHQKLNMTSEASIEEDRKNDEVNMEAAVQPPDSEKTEDTKKAPTLINFVRDGQKIINAFEGLIRMATRAYLNNSRKSDKNLYEELDQAIHTVVRRAFFGDKRSSASEYVTNNLFPAFGRRYDASEGPLHLYRMGISNTKVTRESLDGRNSVLRSSRVPRFPDAVLEDLFSNLRFVYIFSGTGWLNALNNLDRKYQAKYLYVPDRDMEKEIHEAYVAWKQKQYMGTEFYVERITGEEKKTSGLKPEDHDTESHKTKDISAACRYITQHIDIMKKYGISGSVGAIICPPRDLADSLLIQLERSGMNMNKIAILKLKGGSLTELNKKEKSGENTVYEKVGDTFHIDVSDGRYYYVVTAYRSGTRGYNIAFRNGDEVYDASGVMLYQVTNVIPQRGKPKKHSTYEEIENNKTEHALKANLAYSRLMLLHDGKIDPEVLRRVNWLISKISYDKDILHKDIYIDDPWSPYKLQGTSEILQALGRIRNNRKTPAIYIGINEGVFAANQLRPEQLDAQHLSYEGLQVFKKLSALWSDYEEFVENAKILSGEQNHEADYTEIFTNLVKRLIPHEKKALQKGCADTGKLVAYVSVYEALKDKAISLNMKPAATIFDDESKDCSSLTAFNKVKNGIWLSGRRYNGRVYPFEYRSFKDSLTGLTTYTREVLPGKYYITPSDMLLTETISMYSGFCENEMQELMPEIMNPKVLEVMREKDMFPYAISKYGYDILLGEFGERLFLAVMKRALLLKMTELSVRPMPLPEYEDFDYELDDKHGSAVGYVNVKYHRERKFNAEREAKYYIEKALRSPLTGTIRILYINMRPAGERLENYYAKTHEVFTDVNDELAKHGKTIEVLALAPFSQAFDTCIDKDKVNDVIGDQMIKRINRFFNG